MKTARPARRTFRALLLALPLLGACGNGEKAESGADPFASTYAPLPSDALIIRNATILTGTGERIDDGELAVANGRISEVSRNAGKPWGAVEIDAAGRWITPGIIDVHSHLGVYPSPGVWAHSDGNEMSAPVTAEVWAEHSVWPQDPGFATALAGGVTSLQILPGSANLIGGRSVTVKNVPSRTVAGMKFPGAPYGLKMACGENPKRVYGRDRKTAPGTRMGNVAGYRAAWIEAANYLADLEAAEAGGEAPDRDLKLDTLSGVLRGDILVHIHCYRADEMAIMMDVAREFGYQVASFHHAVEAYKIGDLLAGHGACASMWADWWGFKIEAYDTVRENIPLVHKAGACAIVHSDSDYGIQRLNQEAAKAMAAGNRSGIQTPPEIAISWITSNPARALGIDDQTGSLQEGKMADFVIWDRNPFSVYAKAMQVYIDGALVYDREDPSRQPVSDFLIGTQAQHGGEL